MTRPVLLLGDKLQRTLLHIPLAFDSHVAHDDIWAFQE